jgi:hypothetical protein
MKRMQGLSRAGWMAGVAAMMVAAVSAGAQTQMDATNAVDVQAQIAKQQAQVQEDAARVQSQLAPLQGKLQAQLAPLQAKLQAQMVPMQARLQAQMLPMEAKLDVMMVPMQAEMLARGAQLQAQMLVRGAVMQAGMVSVGDPQVKDELFAGTEKFAQGATNVTDVNLGPDMLGMVSGKHGGDVAHKLNFMVVRTYEYPRAGMYRMEDVEAYRQKLRTGNWNCFIHTHESETGESTDICNRALPNDEGNEMVIMTVEPKELTFIHMSGKGSLADLGKLGALGSLGALGNLGGQTPEPPSKAAPHE